MGVWYKKCETNELFSRFCYFCWIAIHTHRSSATDKYFWCANKFIENLGDIVKIGSGMEKGERVAVGCISYAELVLCMVYGKYYIRGWSEADLLSVSFLFALLSIVLRHFLSRIAKKVA